MMSTLKATIASKDGKERLSISEVRFESSWLLGRLDHISCSGSLLDLFHALESAANQNMLGIASRVGEQIDALGFSVSIDEGDAQACHDLQLMNGGDVCLVITPSSE